jgi:hypothetical protein
MGRIVGWLFVIALLGMAGRYGASELAGEVVQIETYDELDARYKTSLWIVDIHGDSWLRAGDPNAAWLQRIEINPEILLFRDDEILPVSAELVDEYGAAINEAMREKYGLADRLVSLLHDDDEVVPIRLTER